MAKPADRSGASAVLPYLYQLVPGLPRLGTSIGREERRRGTNSLELQNANFFCSLLPRVSCRRCKVQLLHLVLQDAKTSGMSESLRSFRSWRPRLRAPGSGCYTRRRVHRGPIPAQCRLLGWGQGVLALPLAFVAEDSHRLLSDARPWRSFPGPGPPGSARGIRGGPGVQPEPRAAHAARRLELTSTIGFISDQARLHYIRIRPRAQ